eukprot:CAMPEP_0168355242 /NCGR_PEP_ID=MMETSP0213-20121227/24412_1 /TAXON_ID=151035 /ORGANISM="Euplotes harpa, Strain FSP1.4" /LENGTH=50 /DNA_ID=CAMNT_0008367371 /DNA_START=301 /DNA_END=450 /DNA_ORIENTATION=-
MVLSGALKCTSNDWIVKDYEIIYKDESMKEIFEYDVIADSFTITAEITSG